MGVINNKNNDIYHLKKKDGQYLVALAGNPNTGKSSIFNNLTKLRQHTGNWPGKTVANARGNYEYRNTDFILVDVPGTYSLLGLSEEEVIARDFICFGKADATVVVTDATCLKRNLSLLFQVLEITKNVILVVNLIDEATKKGIIIDGMRLEYELGIPVILTSAKTKLGMDKLKEAILNVCEIKYPNNPRIVRFEDETEAKINQLATDLTLENKRYFALRIIEKESSFFDSMNKYLDASTLKKIHEVINKNSQHKIIDVREKIISKYYQESEFILSKCVKSNKNILAKDIKIDKIVTSKLFGIPLMLCFLAIVFYLTIQFANIPSAILFRILFSFEEVLRKLFSKIHFPKYLTGMIIDGGYRSFVWVVSVMLPPMAIFFPLFTFLEDFGYLPRIAYNLDHKFKRCGAHGKQSLSMCMGFGCNAAGVIGTRIIDSKREKLIAIITNNFVPCNGRFPTIIAISSAFFIISNNSLINSFIPTLSITVLVVFGIIFTLLVSRFLSLTLLRGETSTFTLELPPYRSPNLIQILYRSLIDRTLFVLGRAVIVCLPTGIITWCLANTYYNNIALIQYMTTFFERFGWLLGLDGVILLAFILGIPANEIVLPIIIMIYASTGRLTEINSISALRDLLIANNWTILTAINMLLFSLLHWPCSTTLLTIKKETNSYKWTVISFLLPTLIAITVCMSVAFIYRLL